MSDPLSHGWMPLDQPRPRLVSACFGASPVLVVQVVTLSQPDELLRRMDQFKSFQGINFPMSLLCLPPMNVPHSSASDRHASPRTKSSLLSPVSTTDSPFAAMGRESQEASHVTDKAIGEFCASSN